MEIELADWLAEQASAGTHWYVKRLSANDTLATKSNQAGPYIAKEFLFAHFPELNNPESENPSLVLRANVRSHPGATRDVRAVWYNSKVRRKGSRNEARITGWGGGSSPILDPESTGSLAVFVFRPSLQSVDAWVCRSPLEEAAIEDRVAPIEPGVQWVWTPSDLLGPRRLSKRLAREPVGASCRLTRESAPQPWLFFFPSVLEIVREVCSRRPATHLDADTRLMIRRSCEFEMFLSMEEIHEFRRITEGYASIDAFIGHANSILQRRKSRSGRSLELHVRQILIEEELEEGLSFSHQPESESGKRPDFLFPSEAAYKDPIFPAEKLRMLAIKTTCKDRWRQILNEADRIPEKHLLTLQEGVSVSQFAEMQTAGVQLVVPRSLLKKFPEEIRDRLLTLEAFLADLRAI